MILLIDNYDSFSYNLFQQAAAIEPDMRVVRNDALTVSEIEGLNPSHIILSPGPGYPKDAGICEEVVSRLGGSIPILGVCLGHQAICEAFGGRIEHAQQLMHGKQSIVEVDTDEPLFKGLEKRPWQRAIILWSPHRILCRSASRSSPVTKEERSWLCGIRPCRFTACSFIRNPS